MTYHGHVQDGVIVLDGDNELPEGAAVQIVVVTRDGDQPPPKRGTLYDHFASVIGTVKGLPPDASQNVDAYLYGDKKLFAE